MGNNNRRVSLAGKTALITGGGIRVGEAIARRLAASGANLILHYHSNETAAETTAASLQADYPAISVYTIQADLSSAAQIERLTKTIAEEMPPVDILINSASVFYPTPLAEITVPEWNSIMDINLRAPFLLAQHFGLLMKQRGWGRIINILDCSIKRHYKNFTPYLVSKNALATLTEVMALELGPEVTVNGVAPGTVMVPAGSSEEYKAQALKRSVTGNFGDAVDIAEMVNFLLEHGMFITGSIHFVDGGASIRP